MNNKDIERHDMEPAPRFYDMWNSEKAVSAALASFVNLLWKNAGKFLKSETNGSAVDIGQCYHAGFVLQCLLSLAGLCPYALNTEQAA